MFVRLGDYDCGIIDSQGKVICRSITSAIYRGPGPGLNGYIYHNNNIYDLEAYSHNTIRSYVFDILVSKKRGLLVGKDNVWYFVERDGSMTPCFNASPIDITKNLKLCTCSVI